MVNVRWPVARQSQQAGVMEETKTDEEPILSQLRRSRWNWLGQTLWRSDNTAKHVLQLTSAGKRNVQNGLQVQLEETGDGSTRQS